MSIHLKSKQLHAEWTCYKKYQTHACGLHVPCMTCSRMGDAAAFSISTTSWWLRPSTVSPLIVSIWSPTYTIHQHYTKCYFLWYSRIHLLAITEPEIVFYTTNIHCMQTIIANFHNLLNIMLWSIGSLWYSVYIINLYIYISEYLNEICYLLQVKRTLHCTNQVIFLGLVVTYAEFLGFSSGAIGAHLGHDDGSISQWAICSPSDAEPQGTPVISVQLYQPHHIITPACNMSHFISTQNTLSSSVHIKQVFKANETKCWLWKSLNSLHCVHISNEKIDNMKN